MRIKFDDGEHATTLPVEFVKFVPEINQRIHWELQPDTEDDLLPGKYRVEGVDWLITREASPLITVHLVLL